MGEPTSETVGHRGQPALVLVVVVSLGLIVTVLEVKEQAEEDGVFREAKGETEVLEKTEELYRGGKGGGFWGSGETRYGYGSSSTSTSTNRSSSDSWRKGKGF